MVKKYRQQGPKRNLAITLVVETLAISHAHTHMPLFISGPGPTRLSAHKEEEYHPSYLGNSWLVCVSFECVQFSNCSLLNVTAQHTQTPNNCHVAPSSEMANDQESWLHPTGQICCFWFLSIKKKVPNPKLSVLHFCIHFQILKATTITLLKFCHRIIES